MGSKGIKMSNDEPNLLFIDSFISDSDASRLYDLLRNQVDWNKQMKSRYTASFGVAYEYSGLRYEPIPFTDELAQLASLVEQIVGFKTNSCLLNYYLNGNSKMGFHSDDMSQMVDGTGVAIISLGSQRRIIFKNKVYTDIQKSYDLPRGSLIYMDDRVQKEWLHAIAKSLVLDDSQASRISITFRQLIV